MRSHATYLDQDEPYEVQDQPVVQGDCSMSPLMIKQVLNAQQVDSGLNMCVDGRVIKHFGILGVVTACYDDVSSPIYTVCDGTGTMTVYYLPLTLNFTSFEVGSYVYVCGRLAKQTLDCMNAYCIRSVRDHNQIASHALEALLCHKYVLASGVKSLLHTSSVSSSRTSARDSTKENILSLLQSKGSSSLSLKQILECGHFSGISVQDLSRALHDLSVEGSLFESGPGSYSVC